MDRLKQIESFVAVATKGSLTAAALAEGVAPAVDRKSTRLNSSHQ